MAQTMSHARDEVLPGVVADDACLRAWRGEPDLTIRLIRAIVAGVRAEPAVNGWFDPAEIGRRLLPKIHLGIAVDAADGSSICVMQDVGNRGEDSLRKGLQKMKAALSQHAVPPEELRGYTLTLYNFGRYGGRYALAPILPPTMAAVAAGAVRDAVVPVDGAAQVCPVLPLSVSYDQRAVTAAEATRCLAAIIADLERAD
jgi:pyruvate dehydrogenase E2 component (dihydrolipoamide acetyltransferase)